MVIDQQYASSTNITTKNISSLFLFFKMITNNLKRKRRRKKTPHSKIN